MSTDGRSRSASLGAQEQPIDINHPQKVQIDADGTIHVPAFLLPLSAALSSEARQMQLQSLMRSGPGLPSIAGLNSDEEFASYVDKYRTTLDEQLIGPLSRAIAGAFPVDISQGKLAGVPVEEFTPSEQKDPRRVLINLHGGAFMSGATYGGRVESMPLASLGKIKVVSVDYRQGYEHKYPAASEDVTIVYRELLKTYASENIGIYGGSAGGKLTAQATAWILDQGLPAPGAIGIFGSGGGGGGDSTFFGKIGQAEIPPPASAADDPVSIVRPGGPFGYLSNVAPNDPLGVPLYAPQALLAQFPPTLLISATRAFDMSPAIRFHRALTQAGVDAALHIFDGLGHCFYYNPWMPESKDAYDTMIRFFDRHLGTETRT